MNNLTKRVLVGIVGVPVILFLSYVGGISFLIFSIVVSSLALWEFFLLFEKKNYNPLKVFTVIISICILFASVFLKMNPVILLPAAFVLLAVCEIFRKEKVNPLNTGIAVFGLVYITLPFFMLNELLKINSFNVVILLFILIWVCDTAAYFGGRFFGRRMLSPISPKKTIEGAISGFLLSIIASIVFLVALHGSHEFATAIAFGIIVGVFAQAGDLFESSIKRYCNVKDSSDIIPGHGGIFDRFDSLLFVTPVVYVYCYWTNYI